MRAVHAVWFVFIYVWEVILSTWQLVTLVIQPEIRLRPCFVVVPLDLEGEAAPFLLACLVSMTPGTMSVALDLDRRELLVHVLDSEAEQTSVAAIKERLEKPLLRVFGNKEGVA